MVELETLGAPLAHGRTADVYAWGDGYILKLFHDWFGMDSIQYEATVCHLVYAGGLPAPRPGDIVRVAGHNGLVYERIDGPNMLQAMRAKPWRLPHFARRLGTLHARMHANGSQLEIPSQRDTVARKVNRAAALPASLRRRVLVSLDAMPGGHCICHGDLHPENVLVTNVGEVAIDWENVTCGNPLADVARSSIIMLGDAAARPRLAVASRLFHAVYIRQYFRLRPGGKAEYRRWLPIAAAARLNENIPEIERWLIRQASQIA